MTDSIGTVVVYSPDLFFGMRIRNALKQLGYELALATTIEAFQQAIVAEPTPVLGIVDFNRGVDWEQFAPSIAGDVTVIAFGAHTDVDGFRAAKTAGVVRTLSNGSFNTSLPDLLARYAGTSAS